MATLIEVTDLWGRQSVSALVAVHGGKVHLGEPMRIKHEERPEPEPERPQITSDPAEIAAFFKAHVA